MTTKKIITIGILTATAIGLIACAKTFKNNYKTTTPVFAEEEIEDLTNTNWTIKKPSQITGGINYINYFFSLNYELKTKNNDYNLQAVRFTPAFLKRETLTWNTKTNQNNEGYPYIYADYTQQKSVFYVDNANTVVKLGDIELYITITGGLSVEDQDAIEWFNTNALQGHIPDPEPEPIQYEAVDIVGLMYQILTMPFSFITQAFNVTLWEGTPYQFNISNFIMSLIAIATILFIIKLFTSGFSALGNYTNSRANKELTKNKAKPNNTKAEKIKKED